MRFVNESFHKRRELMKIFRRMPPTSDSCKLDYSNSNIKGGIWTEDYTGAGAICGWNGVVIYYVTVYEWMHAYRL